MLGLWAILTLTGMLYSVWLGYSGRAYAATLTAFAFLFLIMLLFAARGVETSLATKDSGDQVGIGPVKHHPQLASLLQPATQDHLAG